MTKKMRVSVAMATFNGEKYLREQLDSLAAQSLLPDEIVICDDGSTDNTLGVARKFASVAPFAVAIHRNAENLGYAKNFEKAAKLCRGDIVFFCDQDDVWYPQKVSEVVRHFDDPDVQVVINDADLVSADLSPLGKTQIQALMEAGLHIHTFIFGCFSAHRKSWQGIAIPTPSGEGHDNWINGLAHECGVAKIIRNPLQVYRRHRSNSSQWTQVGIRFARTADFREHGLHKCFDHWERVSRTFLEMKERVSACSDLFPTSKLENAVASLTWRRHTIDERIRIGRLGRVRRGPKVLKFWISGGYAFERGILSAFKDLVRP
jgi:glycosyltransferase involved in cell wall biosynthesis